MTMSPDEVIAELFAIANPQRDEIAAHVARVMEAPLTQSIHETYDRYLERLEDYHREIAAVIATSAGYRGDADAALLGLAKEKLDTRLDRVRAVIDGRNRARA